MVATVKHTPGPWRIGMDSLPARLRVRDQDNRLIADVGHSNGSISAETAQANARLIAASPDLLAALRDLCAIDDEHSFTDDGPPGEEWKSDELTATFNAARVALAKAES